MKKLCYPGTFDPITFGHLDVIKRAARLCDKLIILVADNISKKPIFSVSERINMIKKTTKDIPNIEISYTDGLSVDFCIKNNVDAMVRGLRNITDYENEYSLFYFNRNINESIETIILFPSSRNYFISSSKIKELLVHGVDISLYVPKSIIPTIKNKIKNNLK